VRPGLVILDLRYGRLVKRARDLCLWAFALHPQAEILALYTSGDRDTVGILADLKFKDCPFDHIALAEIAKVCEDHQLNSERATRLDLSLLGASTFLDRDHEVVPLDDEDAERLLTTARKMIADQNKPDEPGLNRARWILSTLSQMPVPIFWYEQAARRLGRSTLKRLIDRLDLHYEHGLGPVMQSLKMQFEKIWQQFSGIDTNPRSRNLVRLLPSLVEEFDNVLFLVRDHVTRQALLSWFDVEAFPGESWMSKVELCACHEYPSLALRRFPLALVNGVLPRRHRWIAGAALGRFVKFLAYPSEGESIVQQLGEFYSAEAIEKRALDRDKAICGTIGTRRAPPILVPKLRLRKPPQPARQKGKTRDIEGHAIVRSLTDLGKALETAKTLAARALERKREETNARTLSWEDATEEEHADDIGMYGQDELPHGDDVNALRFLVVSRLRGQAHLWLAEDQFVEAVQKSNPDEISRITPKYLNLGDTLVLVEEEARGSLFDRVVDLAEDQPELHYLRAYRKTWEEATKILARKYDTAQCGCAKLLADLRSAGSIISTELSVQNWIQGRVIGPDDFSSIKAVGEVSGIVALKEHPRDFDEAFQRIRGLHQGLGRRLMRAIRGAAGTLLDAENAPDSDTLTSYIWLPLNELLETVDLVEVIGVADHTQRVPAYRSGRLLFSD
jgi:hypothetical protein